MKKLLLLFVVLNVVIFLHACQQSAQDHNAMIDSLTEVTTVLSAANSASAVVNPYMLPISIGLAGLTAVLEALRRKEKSSRQHAEQELNNGNNNK